MARTVIDPAAVEAQVTRIAVMNKQQLRELWRTMHKADPPRAFGPDLLRRSLAYKVQENAFGGHSAEVRRELAGLVKRMRANPTAKIELPRRIGAGAVLVREWKGKVHRVTVVEGGFLHEGQTYESLSEIANQITGTRWNGPRFFGLRAGKRTSISDEPSPPLKPIRGRGRPRGSGKSQSDTRPRART